MQPEFCTQTPCTRLYIKIIELLQASFDPPGLSLAVKKDRAVETLLQPGGCFVVNILAEEGHKRVAKALLRPFKPGDDRFEGLETQASRVLGQAFKE